MRIHRFQNMKVAQAAVAYLNERTGYPIPGSETQSYACIQEAKDVVFIQADAVTEEHLGTAEEYEFPSTI